VRGIIITLMTITGPALKGRHPPIYKEPRKDRQRWRNKQRKHRQEKRLDTKNIFSMLDLTPYNAVEKIRKPESDIRWR